MPARTTILIPAAAASVLVTVYAISPAWLAESLFQAVAWGSVVALVSGCRRHGATGPPWMLIGAGFALFAAGDLLFTLNEHLFDVESFPSGADIAYVSGYPLLAAGLASLVRRSRPGGDRIAVIDAGIIVVPAAVATWIYLVEPYASGEELTLVARVVSAGYPLGDLMCLAVGVRLLTGGSSGRPRHQQPALAYLITGLAVMLIADVFFLSAQLHGTYVSGGWTDGLYVVPYVALAAAALSPSVAAIGSPRAEQDVAIGRRRLLVLAVSSVVTPSILIIQWLDDGGLTVPLVVGGTVITFLLVVARMSGLVHALEASRERLRFDATHDVLTGLANRMLFADSLSEKLVAGSPGALLFIDLDRFKQVNDTFGHRAGDAVLVEVARRLCECVRDDDVVGRLAGDEFVVLITSADHTAVYLVAERILSRLEIDAGSADQPLLVTASIGLVTWPAGGGGRDADALLSDADRAMYRAKGARGNQLVVLRSA